MMAQIKTTDLLYACRPLHSAFKQCFHSLPPVFCAPDSLTEILDGLRRTFVLGSFKIVMIGEFHNFIMQRLILLKIMIGAI